MFVRNGLLETVVRKIISIFMKQVFFYLKLFFANQSWLNDFNFNKTESRVYSIF